MFSSTAWAQAASGAAQPNAIEQFFPFIIIIAIFFWGTAFDGILGMLLAIPLTAFFVTAWRLARFKYLRRGTLK